MLNIVLVNFDMGKNTSSIVHTDEAALQDGELIKSKVFIDVSTLYNVISNNFIGGRVQLGIGEF